MTGILIDVNTRAESAKRDLEQINRHLAQLVTNSNASSAALGRLAPTNVKQLNSELGKTSSALGRLKTAGSQTFSVLTAPVRATTNALFSMQGAIAGVVAGFATIKSINAFHAAADDLTLLENKLRLVIQDTSTLAKKQHELYQVSRATRSSFEDTTKLFGDFAFALRKTGQSHTEITKTVTTIKQMATLSGASATSLKAAFVQFNQGIASGTLRGEELNSVLEQMPYLGQKLQESLGMNAGSLRKFAEEGKLTTTLLMKTIKELAESTDADFKRTAFTAAQGINQLRGAVSYFIGTINKHYGFADRFSKTMLRLADGANKLTNTFTHELFNLNQSIKNYIRNFDLFDALQLTVKGMLHFEIMPWDAYSKYKEFKKVKSHIDRIRDILGVSVPKIQIKAPEIDIEASGKSNISVDKQAKSLKVTLKEIGSIIYESGNFVKVGIDNIARLIPIIGIPVKTIGIQARQMFVGMKADLNALIYDAVMPATRVLEAFAETLTLFTIGDNELERSWVNLFKSDSLKDFTKNLKELNVVRAKTKANDESYLMREAIRGYKQFSYAIEDTLIFLNLLDNRLIKIRDTRFDRIVKYFSEIGSVAKRVYQDVFATTLEPLAIKATEAVRAALFSVLDAISDYFTRDSGLELGKAFVGGITAGLSRAGNVIGEAFRGLFEKDWLEFNFTETLSDKLIKAFKSIAGFIVGFVQGIFTSIKSNIDVADLFDKLVESASASLKALYSTLSIGLRGISNKIKTNLLKNKIRWAVDFDTTMFESAIRFIYKMFAELATYALDKLAVTESYISRFGNNIKNTFFGIYDAVVGHSYWPDTIDGVVEHTKNLFEANTTVASFSDQILTTFKDLYKRAVTAGINTGGLVSEFSSRLASIDWTAATKTLAASLGASILAGVLFAFGGLKSKLFAASYFIALFDTSLNKAFSTLMEPLVESIAASSGKLAEKFVEGFITTLNNLLRALPVFVNSFLKSLGPIGEGLSAIFNIVPIFHNKVLLGILGAMTAYALLVKGGRKEISAILFGEDKVNKKTGIATHTDGALDYIGALFNKNRANRKVAPFFDSVFANKPLAIAAGATFASAFLDSVSAFQSVSLGLPLLAFAIMGKDGGARIIRDAAKFALNTVRTIYTILTKTAVMNSNIPWLETFLDAPLKLIDRLTSSQPKIRSKLAVAFGAVFGDIGQMFKNLNTNSAKYAAGSMSLGDSLLTIQSTNNAFKGVGGGVTSQKIQFGRTFSDLTNEIKNIKFLDNTVGDVFSKLADRTRKGFDGFRSILSKDNPITAGLLSFTGGIFEAIKQLIVGTLTTARVGLSTIFDFFKNHKIVTFVTLLAGFSGVSYAASDASTAVGGFAKNLAIVLGFTVGIGVMVKAFSAFTAARNAFLADKLSKNYHELIEVPKKQKYKEVLESLGPTRAGTRAKAQEVADAFERDLRKSMQKGDIFNKEAFSAGLSGIKSSFMDGESSFGKFSKAMGTIFRVPLSAIRAVRLSLKELTPSFVVVSDSLKRAFAIPIPDSAKVAAYRKLLIDGVIDLNAFKKIDDGLANAIYRAVFRSKAVISTLSTDFMANMRLIGEALIIRGGNLRAAFSPLLDSLRAAGGQTKKVILELLGSLFTKLKTFAKVGGFAVTGGLLALQLFGSGNGFFEKLEWAYDKVRAIVGLEAKTGTGRRGDLSSKLKPVVFDAKTKFDVSASLATIDFEKLSTTEYTLVTQVANEASEALKQLQLLAVKQGGLTDAQRAEVGRIEREVANPLNRFPQKGELTADAKVRETVGVLTRVDNSLWTVFKVALGWTPVITDSIKELTMFQKAINWVVDAIGTVGRIFLWIAKGLWTAFKGLALAIMAGAVFLMGGWIAGIAAAVVAAGIFLYDAITDWLPDDAKKIFETLSNGINGFVGVLGEIGKTISDKFDLFLDKFGLKPAQSQLDERDRVVAAGAKYYKYEQMGDSDLVAGMDVLRTKYEDAFEKMYKLQNSNYVNTTDMSLSFLYKNRKDAEAEFKETQRIYFEALQLYGEYNERKFVKQQLDTRLEALSNDTKNLFDFDIGPLAKDFNGFTKDIVQLEESIAQSKMRRVGFEGYNYSEYANTPEQRRIKKQFELSDGITQKAFFDQVGADLLTDTSVTFKAKLLGDDAIVSALNRVQEAAAIREFTVFDPKTEKTVKTLGTQLDEAAAKLNILESKYAGRSSLMSTVELKTLIADIAAARAEMINLSKTSTVFDEINERLGKFNLEKFNRDEFVLFKEDSLKTVAAQLDNIRLTTDRINTLNRSNTPWEQRVSLMRQLNAEMRLANSLLAEQKYELLSRLLKDQNVSGIAKEFAVGPDKFPNHLNVSTRKKALDLEARRARIAADIKAIEADDARAPKLPSGNKYQDSLNKMAEERYEKRTKLQRELSKLDDQIAKTIEKPSTSDKDVFNLDKVLSLIQDAGVDFTKENYRFADTKVRKTIREQAKIIADADNVLEKAIAGGQDSAITAAIDKRTNALKTAADAMSVAMYASGDKILEGLSRVGLSDMDNIANLQDGELDALLKYDTEIQLQRRKLAEARKSKDIAGFEVAIAALNKLERGAAELNMQVDRIFSSQIDSVNQLFKTEFDTSSFSGISDGLRESLFTVAKYFKIQFEKLSKQGISAVSKELTSQYTAAFRKVKLVDFLGSLARDFSESLTTGINTSFEKLKSRMPELSLEFKDYLGLSGDTRKSVDSESLAIEQLKRALNLDLNQAQLDIISRLNNGDSAVSVVQELAKSLNLGKIDVPVDPIVQNTTETSKNTSALEKNSALLQDFIGNFGNLKMSTDADFSKKAYSQGVDLPSVYPSSALRPLGLSQAEAGIKLELELFRQTMQEIEREFILNKRASGGYITGPGGPRDDKIPALLSNGEFVVNAKSTRKNRGLLHAINSGVANFANGGPVSTNLLGNTNDMATKYPWLAKLIDSTSSVADSNSIVDHMKAWGLDASKGSRGRFFDMLVGGESYRGSASQNMSLIEAFKNYANTLKMQELMKAEELSNMMAKTAYMFEPGYDAIEPVALFEWLLPFMRGKGAVSKATTIKSARTPSKTLLEAMQRGLPAEKYQPMLNNARTISSNRNLATTIGSGRALANTISSNRNLGTTIRSNRLLASIIKPRRYADGGLVQFQEFMRKRSQMLMDSTENVFAMGLGNGKLPSNLADGKYFNGVDELYESFNGNTFNFRELSKHYSWDTLAEILEEHAHGIARKTNTEILYTNHTIGGLESYFRTIGGDYISSRAYVPPIVGSKNPLKAYAVLMHELGHAMDASMFYYDDWNAIDILSKEFTATQFGLGSSLANDRDLPKHLYTAYTSYRADAFGETNNAKAKFKSMSTMLRNMGDYVTLGGPDSPLDTLINKGGTVNSAKSITERLDAILKSSDMRIESETPFERLALQEKSIKGSISAAERDRLSKLREFEYENLLRKQIEEESAKQAADRKDFMRSIQKTIDKNNQALTPQKTSLWSKAKPMLKTAGKVLAPIDLGFSLYQGFNTSTSDYAKRFGTSSDGLGKDLLLRTAGLGSDFLNNATLGALSRYVFMDGSRASPMEDLKTASNFMKKYLGAPLRRALGGGISGPGGPRDDKIPALLSNGEFVVNARDAKKHWSLLTAINSGITLPGFERGTAEITGDFSGTAGMTAQMLAQFAETARDMKDTVQDLSVSLRKASTAIENRDKQSTISVTQAAIGAAGNVFDKARIGMKALKGTNLTDEALYRADYEELAKIVELSTAILNAQLARITATKPEDQNRLQEQLDAAYYELSKFADKLNQATPKVEQAGEAFASAITEGLKTAFNEFLTGKMGWKDFLKSGLDTVTSAIINAFMEGLLDPLVGKNGWLTTMMRDFGKDLFSAGGVVGNSLKGSSGSSNILRSIGGFFGGSRGIATGGGQNILGSIASLFGFAEGGMITGAGTGTSDSILARLSNGEFVVTAEMTKRFRPLLESLNSGNLKQFAKGGIVGASIMATPAMSDIPQVDPKNKPGQTFNITITGDISRQTRSEIISMLPNIASGVNSYNHEKGISR